MITVYELAESLIAVFKDVFEMVFKTFEEVYEKIVEIIEALETGDQLQNRRSHITVVIGSLNRNIFIPPFVPRRAGWRMGGRMG
jgi:hypothetical protein